MKSRVAAVAVVVVTGLCASLVRRRLPRPSALFVRRRCTSSSSAVLSGVACVSADHCTAVGWSVNPQNSPPLALVWNGGSWKVQPTAEPPVGTGSR